MKWLYVLVLCGVALAHSPEENTGDDKSNLFEGDVVLNAEQRMAIEMGLNIDDPFGRAAQKGKEWPKGIMIFAVDPALSRNSRAMNAIRAGMQEWTKKTCIRFQARKNERAYAYFQPGSGCSSFVGRQGNRQAITLASGCWTRGIVAHEIGHALGFWHEQSRPDRNKFVTILFQNIKENAKFNFNIVRSINSLGFPYDYASVMHYGPKFFSKNGKPTIVQKKKGPKIGQRKGLSKGDAKQMNKKYQKECKKRG